MLLATHDAYHWVAGAEGFEFGAGHPMSELLRILGPDYRRRSLRRSPSGCLRSWPASWLCSSSCGRGAWAAWRPVSAPASSPRSRRASLPVPCSAMPTPTSLPCSCPCLSGWPRLCGSCISSATRWPCRFVGSSAGRNAPSPLRWTLRAISRTRLSRPSGCSPSAQAGCSPGGLRNGIPCSRTSCAIMWP